MRLTLLCLLFACSTEPAPPAPQGSADTAAPAVLACPSFGPAQAMGEVAADDLLEASGLAWHEGVLWAHNDSGAPKLFALNPDGSTHHEAAVDALVLDWEDVARLGQSLWIADVGDNLAARQRVSLLEIPLVEIEQDQSVATPRRLDVSWPLGPVDCETLLADEESGDLLLVTKVMDGQVGVWRVLEPEGAVSSMEKVAHLDFSAPPLTGNTLVTGGDVAPQGEGVVLRTYLDAFVWPRVPGEPWATTFERDPCPVDLAGERQGEAITWAPEGLYSVSEGSHPTLYFYPLLESPTDR